MNAAYNLSVMPGKGPPSTTNVPEGGVEEDKLAMGEGRKMGKW
jgi:hypothetical protein